MVMRAACLCPLIDMRDNAESEIRVFIKNIPIRVFIWAQMGFDKVWVSECLFKMLPDLLSALRVIYCRDGVMTVGRKIFNFSLFFVVG